MTIMIPEKTKDRIKDIWDKYVVSDKIVRNTKGNPIHQIDELRPTAINEIKTLIEKFIGSNLSVGEFKTALDGYNKRNNYWGFPAAKGQMFFNQLVNASDSIDKLSELLKSSIQEPNDLEEAKQAIAKFEAYVRTIYDAGTDKRRLPKPSSVAYFLSYFWQIYNPLKWPIQYSSLVNSFEGLGLWKQFEKQKDEYEYFYKLNEDIKSVLKLHSKMEITNWDAEHAFWNDSGNPRIQTKAAVIVNVPQKENQTIPVKANFDVFDYIVPRVAKLVELGASKERTKGGNFEKMVSDVFKLLDFEVETLGQGTGRNPDAIAKFREDHTAFIIDAKAYGEGYSLGSDDRAIREYITYYCPKLNKEGLRRIGFIIVSNSFKSDMGDFISEITWTTEVSRFILLTSEGLLYLLGYRMKDSLPAKTIIDFLISSSSPITVERVVAEFDDV